MKWDKADEQRKHTLKRVRIALRKEVHLSSYQQEQVMQYMDWVFGIGFDTGIAYQTTKRATRMRTSTPVYSINAITKVEENFTSVADAARQMGVVRHSIQTALEHPQQKCKGRYWRYKK